LVQDGALTPDEWQRAKVVIVGKPKDKQAESIKRVARFYRAYRNEALSRADFNRTKWDILSQIGQHH